MVQFDILGNFAIWSTGLHKLLSSKDMHLRQVMVLRVQARCSIKEILVLANQQVDNARVWVSIKLVKSAASSFYPSPDGDLQREGQGGLRDGVP